jgi:A/G-specific adenine glycosylase
LRDEPATFAATLLAWYDNHARILAWRTAPQANSRPDPYHVWLSEVMLQQTTVAAVDGYFRKFTALWPDVHALATADDADIMAAWAGLGYYARARNLLKCARAVADMSGFPQTEGELRLLPGIGPYTAAAIAAIAFDHPANVVDGNVERVMARYFAVLDPLPASKPHLVALAQSLTPDYRPGDYAQSVMDLGATICTLRNPKCTTCPVSRGCQACAKRLANDLPRRAAKTAKPIRHGQVWIAARSDGSLLAETRPKSGLLGGMLGLPTSGWDGTTAGEPIKANWRSIGEVRHAFTHFHLRLNVLCTDTPIVPSKVNLTAFPTLFRKALQLALA